MMATPPRNVQLTLTADFSLLEKAFQRTRAYMDDLEKILKPLPASKDVLPPLVGVGGHKAHGKDAFADYLAEDSGYFKTFMSEPLADALSQIGPRGPWVRLDFAIAPDMLAGDVIRYDDLVEKIGYTQAKEHRDVREYLQGLGTEVGRNMLGEDVWLEIAKKKIQQARAAGQPVVITGIRFPNELELIHELGGVSVWVERTSWPEKTPHPLTDAIDAALQALEPTKTSIETHASETSVTPEDFEVMIENGSTLEALRTQAADLAAELKSQEDWTWEPES